MVAEIKDPAMKVEAETAEASPVAEELGVPAVILEKTVRDAGVVEIGDKVHANEAHLNLAGTGAAVSGSEHPTTGLGQTNVEINSSSNTPGKIFPSVFDTGNLANGSGKAAGKIVLGRFGRLTNALIPKLFGGKRAA